MTEIFVSYRREDSKAYAGWVCDLLVQHLGPGKIFRDIDGIPPGEDFGKVIGDRLAECKIFLALIGPGWLKAGSWLRRRLFQSGDFVRLEIFIALSRQIVVVPVLVDGARMPSARSLPKSIVDLTHLQAFTISENRVPEEVAKLVEEVKQNLAKAPSLDDKALQAERERVQELISADLRETRRRRRRGMIAACWVAALVAAGIMFWAVRQRIPVGREDAPTRGGSDPARAVSPTSAVFLRNPWRIRGWRSFSSLSPGVPLLGRQPGLDGRHDLLGDGEDAVDEPLLGIRRGGPADLQQVPIGSR
jgi:hypothetical protein